PDLARLAGTARRRGQGGRRGGTSDKLSRNRVAALQPCGRVQERISAMGVLRTPDERFAGLPDYPFEAHYAQVETDGIAPVRMPYVDAGPSDGPVVLLVHGQPTWSYLYRKVIGVLAEAGLRAIASDNIGFGRSDKLTEPIDYTFQRHIDWLH